ncbi:MAG: class I SAM-dependent DNA methyltransferase [Acidimicrobiales bacterium]
MPDPVGADDWDEYVARYHDANAGITEDVLVDARDDRGRTPYDWLVDAVPPGTATVVDLACGSGPLARLLAASRMVGVDRSAAELARARGRSGAPAGLLVRAEASALPITGGCADAVVSSMALMLLRPLDAALAEISRLLRPGGTFVATIPIRAAAPGPGGTPAFAGILGALGQTTQRYPEPLDRATLPGRFSAHGLTLHDDETMLFARTVRGPDDAERVIRSFYSPGAGPDRVAAAVVELQDRVRAAPVGITYRIRRLVARG